MVMSTITLLNTVYTQITELTGTLLNAVRTDYYKRLALESWFTNLEQMLWFSFIPRLFFFQTSLFFSNWFVYQLSKQGFYFLGCG